MERFKKAILLAAACAASMVGPIHAVDVKRQATPEDCVNVRRLHPKTFWHAVQIDNEGRQVAYVVEGADLTANRTSTELYIKSMEGNLSRPAHSLLKAEEISGLHWIADDKRIVALVKKSGSSAIESIDVRNSDVEVLAKMPNEIKEFTVDSKGTVLAFDTDEAGKNVASGVSSEDVFRGYRIPFDQPETEGIQARRIYISRRNSQGVWSLPLGISITTPFEKQSLNVFPGVDNHGNLNLSLSPGGNQLLFSYKSADALPDTWKESLAVKRFLGAAQPVMLTILYDLRNGTATLPLKSPWQIAVPFWSYDGRSYVTIGLAPIGSIWEKEDRTNNTGLAESLHTFVVDIADGEVHRVHLPPSSEPAFDEPLAWGKDGVLILHSALDTIVRVTKDRGEWYSGMPMKIPLRGVHGYSEFSSNGQIAVGSYESPSVPPELYVYNLSTGEVKPFTKLNPQFDGIETASAEDIDWRTSSGYDIQGKLIKPPDFIEGRRYPLVIQTQPGGNEFVCDSGPHGFPSSVPLPLSDAGILYLYRTLPPSYQQTDDQADYPKGYPGGIAQAAWQMDVWDSAVEALSKRGIIDPTNVGIIGFSRTGWYTEFALTHAKTHYRAADVVDNAQYSLGEYWLPHRPTTMQAMNDTFGGPPYGSALKNWLDYSISFNMDKIQTPLLMEQMGYGARYESDLSVPINLATTFEIFAGLNELHRPVELYYYPDETHQMDHPKAKAANLQRNIDWFRFWLTGYERPNPDDPDQYPRWERLRDFQGAHGELHVP